MGFLHTKIPFAINQNPTQFIDVTVWDIDKKEEIRYLKNIKSPQKNILWDSGNPIFPFTFSSYSALGNCHTHLAYLRNAWIMMLGYLASERKSHQETPTRVHA